MPLPFFASIDFDEKPRRQRDEHHRHQQRPDQHHPVMPRLVQQRFARNQALLHVTHLRSFSCLRGRRLVHSLRPAFRVTSYNGVDGSRIIPDPNHTGYVCSGQAAGMILEGECALGRSRQIPGPSGGCVGTEPQKMRVAFQGEPGAFSEAAAVQLLGEEITTVPRATFDARLPRHRRRRGRCAARPRRKFTRRLRRARLRPVARKRFDDHRGNHSAHRAELDRVPRRFSRGYSHGLFASHGARAVRALFRRASAIQAHSRRRHRRQRPRNDRPRRQDFRRDRRPSRGRPLSRRHSRREASRTTPKISRASFC